MLKLVSESPNLWYGVGLFRKDGFPGSYVEGRHAENFTFYWFH